MSSLITPEQIEQFQNDGAVLLKGVFDQKWVSVGGGELRSISLYIVSPRFAIQIHHKAMVPA